MDAHLDAAIPRDYIVWSFPIGGNAVPNPYHTGVIMFTEIAQILMAIQLSATHYTPPETRATALATTIQERAQYADVDPYIIVAIITHESQWRERAVSGDTEDYGLMQIRGRFYYGGKHNDWLLEGVNNIKIGTYVIKKSKDICRQHLGREPRTQEWLACYTGSCVNGGMCKPTRLTKVIEDYELCLKDVVENNVSRDCRTIYWPELKKQ